MICRECCSDPTLNIASQHDSIGRSYPLPSETCLVGLCTGALPAAAISCCKTLSDLLPIAVQTVLVAFRMGMCNLDVRNRIEDSTKAWSLVTPTSTPEKIAESLDEFSKFNVSKALIPSEMISEPFLTVHSICLVLLSLISAHTHCMV